MMPGTYTLSETNQNNQQLAGNSSFADHEPTTLANIYLTLWLNDIIPSRLTYGILSKLFSEDALALLNRNNQPILFDLNELFDLPLDDESETDSLMDDDTWHDNPGALNTEGIQEDYSYSDSLFESIEECGEWAGDKYSSTSTKSFNVARVIHPRVEYQVEPIELDDNQSVTSEFMAHDDDTLLFEFDEDWLQASTDESSSYEVLQAVLEKTVTNIFLQSINQATPYLVRLNQVFFNMIAQEMQSIAQECIEENSIQKLTTELYKFESDDELERLNRTLSFDSIVESRNITPFRDFWSSPTPTNRSTSRPNSALTMAVDAEKQEQHIEQERIRLYSAPEDDDVHFLMDEDLERLEAQKKKDADKSPQSVIDGIKSPVNISANIKVSNFSLLARAIKSPIQSQRVESDFESIIDEQKLFEPGAPNQKGQFFSIK